MLHCYNENLFHHLIQNETEFFQRKHFCQRVYFFKLFSDFNKVIPPLVEHSKKLVLLEDIYYFDKN